MKTFAKALIGVSLAVALFFAFVLFGPGPTATSMNMTRQSAAERAEVFLSVMEGVRRGDFGTNQFATPDSASAADYEFLTIEIAIQNGGILPVEWAQVNMRPGAGDVVLIPGEPADIGPFSGGTATATLLTRAGSDESERMIWVDYYVFGGKESAIAP